MQRLLPVENIKHKRKLDRALAQMKRLRGSRQPGFISLKPKSTSHFFRERKKTKQLDLLAFTDILSISENDMTAEVEGLVSFKKLTAETLKHGMIPLVCPELRNITVGGTISGIGLEASSFRFGYVHNTVDEYEVITGKGEVIVCSATQNSDLFYTIPNSIGSLGYVTRAKIRLRKAKPYVHLSLLRFNSIKEYTSKFKEICDGQNADFVDSIIFSPEHYVLIVSEMTESLPDGVKLNDFKVDVFWKFLKDKKNSDAYMTIWDFEWRWDTDVYWMLSNKGIFSSIVENKVFRQTLGKLALDSTFLIHKLGKFAKKVKKTSLGKLLYRSNPLYEDVLQDVGVEINKLEEFWQWYEEKIGIFPVWICPNKGIDHSKYPLNNFAGKFFLDIGIYTGKLRPEGTEPYYYNKLLEQKTTEMKGHKGHYSLSFYSEEDFWKLYDKKKYQAVKSKYDPDHMFGELYQKCVGVIT